MTKSTGRFSQITSFLDMFGAAVSASAAVRAHKRPSEHDLRRLGIEAKDFPTTF